MRDFIIGVLVVCVAYLLFRDDAAHTTLAKAAKVSQKELRELTK
jgi:hypothetical protein